MKPKKPSLLSGFSLPLPLFDRNQGGILEAHARLTKAELERRAAEVRVQHGVSQMRISTLPVRPTRSPPYKTRCSLRLKRRFTPHKKAIASENLVFSMSLDVQRTLFETRGQYLEALASLP